jgi:hypothetical protein
MKRDGRKILIDADVISHFVSAKKSEKLSVIFPNNQIYILDKVHAELQRWPSKTILITISKLLSSKEVRLMAFPEQDENISKEYAYIKSRLFKGDGESATLAVARFKNNIIASSNLKDIKSYCATHTIDFLSTMDFLCQALSTNIFTLVECNDFITEVLKAGSILPVKRMEDFICRQILFVD